MSAYPKSDTEADIRQGGHHIAEIESCVQSGFMEDAIVFL